MIPEDEITSESAEGRDNTRLHHAIINNDVPLALRLIAEDAANVEKKEPSIINKFSLGNVPLLLALKTGNIAIAEAILQHLETEVAVTDNHQLTPLHWACMLRQDKIIKAILDKNSELSGWPVSQWWGRSTTSHSVPDEKMSPFYLYTHPFTSIGVASHSVFTDAPRLAIAGQEAYTDIIFHMRSLCRNLHWMNKELPFETLQPVSIDDVSSGKKLFLSSSQVFQYNFKLGVSSFMSFRNAIPCDRELAMRLAISPKQVEEAKKIKAPIVSPGLIGVFPPLSGSHPSEEIKPSPHDEVQKGKPGESKLVL